ncbi:MAG: hypothetical protein ACYSUT_02670 [Planctomycetota bacterium]|jgi:hypothetical protein
MERILICIGVGLLTIALTGCTESQSSQWDTIKQLEQEKTEQAMRADALAKENETLRQQVETLSALDKDTRLKQLDTLVTINLGKRTGLYDKNNDRRKDALLVYLEPIDTQQDYIKAIGTVQVELWNLSNPAKQAKLTEWVLEPAELQKHWAGNVFSAYYRLPLNLEGAVTGTEKELTVKVTFTDLFSGKVLTAQKVIKP